MSAFTDQLYGGLGVYPQNQIRNNSTSSSPFVTTNDVVYFQGTDDRLLKVRADGSDGTRIGENSTSSMPFVLTDPSGEWVYFRGTDDRLLKVRTDGSDGTRIGQNSTKSTPFVTFDSNTGDVWVFFQGTDDRLLKVRADGTDGLNIGGITTKSRPFVTDDGWIWFQGTRDELLRVRSDGTELLRVGDNTTASTPAVGRLQNVGYREGRWVYFQGTDDRLWRFFQPLQEFKRLVQKQPDRILEIQYTNPDHPRDISALYAQTVVFGGQNPSTILGGAFPSRDAEQEWKQVLPLDLTDTGAHNTDHEGLNLVGATGWVLHPECSNADVPFDHPFGFDWEFMLALDQPDADPKRYTFLLTPANQTFAEDGYREAAEEAAKMTGEIQEADSLRDPPVPNADRVIIPPGPDGLDSVLGVEIDGGLVPQQFIEGVRSGDRLAIFGRWIVDCGHQKPITRAPADPNAHPEGDDIHPGLTAFRTEIHPPLLMAAARLTSGSIASGTTQGSLFTRALFTSRPYLVGQRFTTNTDTIWDDSDPGDAPFFSHFVNEVVKAHETFLGIIPLGSTQAEAHPKIRSKPFQGAYTAHFVVRSPFLRVGAHHSVPPARIVVSFQFTVRTGCSVQVTSSGADSVDVVITLDSESYRSPPPLNRRERTWSKDELGQLNPAAADAYASAEFWSNAINFLFPQLGGIVGVAEARLVLDRGIKTDEYDIDELRNVNMLDASRAVTAFGDNIPAGQGVIVNDDQPFPIFGWLEITPVIPPDLIDLNNPVTPVG